MPSTWLLSSNLPLFLSVNTIIYNYILLSAVGFFVFILLQNQSLKNLGSTSSNNFSVIIFCTIFFLNLAGLPPLPGFFIKLNFLLLILTNIKIINIIILILVNFTIFYFYIQFYKYVYTYGKAKKQNYQKSILYWVNFGLLLTLNYYPVHNLLTLIL